jgi:PKD repeat protein
VSLSSRCFTALVGCLLTVAQAAQAQHPAPCAFDAAYQRHQAIYDDASRIVRRLTANRNVLGHDTARLLVPVVVHVIHTGGPENISDSQVRSQIDVLNEDYGRLPGTPGAGPGVDTRLRFCLARRTPDGRCTDGIVRVESPLTNHLSAQRSQLKDLSSWDNTRYLNMYVVASIDGNSGIQGYASFPGGPAGEDGTVMRADAFGRISANSSGRTTSHELGHWAGLYHTFQNGCGTDTCSDGDEVCDTPPVAAPNYGCPANRNTCSNDVPNRPDQISNYLDYTDDACKNQFTAGQRDRMHTAMAAFRAVITSPTNLLATGCVGAGPPVACAVIADFTSNARTICLGNPVTFISRSLNAPTSYRWYFPGGTPATSTTANATVTYAATGTYAVTLVALNAQGRDSVTQTNYLSVVVPPVGRALPYAEDFESAVFPPNGIVIANPDSGITWERDTLAVAYQGRASARINNLINTNYGQSDAMELPGFDFTTFANAPWLRFRFAYARSDPSYSDQLVVQVSTNCGVTYTPILTRSGSALATGSTQTTPYVPDSTTLWKQALVNLSAYRTSTNVLIRLVNVTDGGNNLYVDAISIGDRPTGLGAAPAVPTAPVFPNPVAAGEVLTVPLQGPATVRLLTVLGQEAGRATLVPTGQAAVWQVPRAVAAGAYALRIEQAGTVRTVRVCVVSSAGR